MSEKTETTEPQTAAAEAPAAGATYDLSAGKADPGRRAVAAIIDFFLASVVCVIPVAGWIAGTAYLLARDGLDFTFMDRRSIGKKLMKLRPVTLDGKPLTPELSVRRNWPFAVSGLMMVPFIGWILIIPVTLAALAMIAVEIILTLTDKDGRRYGDRFAGTMVIESEA